MAALHQTDTCKSQKVRNSNAIILIDLRCGSHIPGFIKNVKHVKHTLTLTHTRNILLYAPLYLMSSVLVV